jgi:hypothetical protein
MKKLTADLLKTLLARALGGIIASAATSGGPPPVAIALAAAGVAAISAMFAKIGGPSGGSVGGGSAVSAPRGTVGRGSKQEYGEEIKFDAEFVISGNSLKATASNTDYRSTRLG